MKSIENYTNLKLELSLLIKRREIVDEYIKKYIEESRNLNQLINLQIDILNQIEEDFRKLNGIEQKLFKEIIINGMSISKAVEKVAEEEEKDVSTIWKNYYPKIKDKIKEISNMME